MTHWGSHLPHYFLLMLHLLDRNSRNLKVHIHPRPPGRRFDNGPNHLLHHGPRLCGGRRLRRRWWRRSWLHLLYQLPQRRLVVAKSSFKTMIFLFILAETFLLHALTHAVQGVNDVDGTKVLVGVCQQIQRFLLDVRREVRKWFDYEVLRYASSLGWRGSHLMGRVWSLGVMIADLGSAGGG